MTTPLSDKLRSLLRQVKHQAQLRHKAYLECQQGYAQRQAAIDKVWHESRDGLDAALIQQKASLEEELAQARQRIADRFQKDHLRFTLEFVAAEKRANENFATSKGQVEAQFKENRWTIITLDEADKKVARDQILKCQRDLKTNRAEMRSQYQEALRLVRSWKCAQNLDVPLNKKPNLAPAEPWKVLEQRAELVKNYLGHLKIIALPRLLQGQLMPLAIVLAWMVLSLPGLIVAPWYLWVLASTLTVFPGGWAMRYWMWQRARRQVAFLWQGLAQSVYDAQPLRRLCVAQARVLYKKQRRQCRAKHRESLRLATEQYRQQLVRLAKRLKKQLAETATRFQPLLEQAGQRQARERAAVEEKNQTTQRQVQAAYDRDMHAAQEHHRQQHEDNDNRHDREWRELSGDWQQACAACTTGLRAIDAACRQQFPTWEAIAAHWQTPAQLPAGIPFGTLGVSCELIPFSEPEDARLARLDLADVVVPALLPFPEKVSLLFKAVDQGRDVAVQALQALLLRYWTSLPPGKFRCTIIDPVGRGENFAAFMHLADHDESLINSRIWTESSHIDHRLADLTTHMETVLQKFLRNKYQTLAEYNAQAGEVAEPFRLLVVSHFPVNFSTEAARRLISLASSGTRCGIYTLVLVDDKQPLPHGVELSDLEAACINLVWRQGQFLWRDPDFAEYPLTLAQPPAAEMCTSILGVVGEKAKLANRVEVPFESIAPTADEMWTADSRASIAVPLGRTGATARQLLTLGKGTSQHVLIAGKTGSGKSTLLHVLITQLVTRYSPREIELYLIDFKKGVEFKTYATHQLPHARVVAVESEREFGLSVLQRLDVELVRRGEIFRTTGVNDLPSYRQWVDGSQKSEVGGRKSEVGDRRSEVGGRRSEAGSQKSEVGSRKSEAESQPPNPPPTSDLRSPSSDPMPRILLIVDEFQEFFVEDDKIAQEAALLMDRLVRQGRAFGIHVILGSQTLGGAYSLARSTIDQMAVRIALQCSEADAHLILSKENSEARLLSRPGEAIFNAANGMLEGNNLFQIVWLADQRRDHFLDQALQLAHARSIQRAEPLIVFEGSTPSDLSRNSLLKMRAAMPGMRGEPKSRAPLVWLGDAVAIKDPTAAVFHKQSGANLLIIGQNSEAAFSLMVASAVSLAAQLKRTAVCPAASADLASTQHSALSTQHSSNGDGSLAPIALISASPLEEEADHLLQLLPDLLPMRLVGQRDLPTLLNTLSEELQRRQKDNADGEPLFLLLFGLQRLRDLRKADDDFGFSRRGEDKTISPAKQFQILLRDGPPLGIFTILWCDTMTNLQRSFDRQGLREFEMRVVFQMNAGDSSNLLDSPVASKLGPHRALFYTEDQGKIEKFRPYALPSLDWLREFFPT